MAPADLFSADLLPWLLPHLTHQDASKLCLTCTRAAAAYRAVAASNALLHTPAPRVVICCSDSQQLLELPLTPEGRPYMHQAKQLNVGQTRSSAVSRRTRSQTAPYSWSMLAGKVFTAKQRSQQWPWLTGIAFSPYDHALYVAAYGDDVPAQAAAASKAGAAKRRKHALPAILRFSPGTLRPGGILIESHEIADPEGLGFAKGLCYVASAGHAAVVAVSVQDGSVQQKLDLAEDAVPWGMAAWDPSTYPLHALAARHAATLRNKQQPGHQPQQLQHAQQQQQQPAASPECAAAQLEEGSQLQPDTTDAAAADAEFHAGAAQGCLFVAVQADIAKQDWWAPPAGPASGSLVCVPISSEGRMLCWRVWSTVKIKRPSGVTIDHAGHVWTTSLERLLLRFAGPCCPNSGCLLQQVNLVQMLPAKMNGLFPMDVQAAVILHPGGCRQGQGLCQNAADVGNCCIGPCSSLLVVTAHAGPRQKAAVAVLKACDGSSPGCIQLLACQEVPLKQPNMVAVQ